MHRKKHNSKTNNPKVGKKNNKYKGSSSDHINHINNEVTVNGSVHVDGTVGMLKSPSAGTLSRMERQNIVLWKRPCHTLWYFLLEIAQLAFDFIRSMLVMRRLLPSTLFIGCFLSLYLVPGIHSSFVTQIEKKLLWCLYWIGLGVLSSVGLGTGLHTFLLYLGPHIARVTLAAFECNSLDFPEPPYPDDVTCPINSTTTEAYAVTLWTIISKVRLESLMWGAGTALGELPPYFMARAARLSGQEPEDEEYKEFIHFVEGDRTSEMTLAKRFKLWMEQIVTRIGFFGVLLFASIPNPFFDLAGITCGHFLVPFWTFFGATLIGKALVKMHVQMLFVVLTFSEHHVEHLMALLKQIPRIGIFLQAPIKEFLLAQKLSLHRQPGEPVPKQATSLLQQVMSYVVSAMILWFVVSLINSLAQRYHKRKWKAEKIKL